MPRTERFANDVDEDDWGGADGLDDWDDDTEGDEDLDGDDVDEEASEFDARFAAPLTLEDSVARVAAAAGEHASWYLGGQIAVPAGEMVCRGCGCRDSQGCPGGCLWAAPNLCSRCVS